MCWSSGELQRAFRLTDEKGAATGKMRKITRGTSDHSGRQFEAYQASKWEIVGFMKA